MVTKRMRIKVASTLAKVYSAARQIKYAGYPEPYNLYTEI